MTEIRQKLIQMIDQGAYRFVLTEPVSPKADSEKVIIQQKRGGYLAEEFRERKAFHTNLAQTDDLLAYLDDKFGPAFLRLNAWTDRYEYAMRISKKGKLLFNRAAATATAPKRDEEHNRQKRCLLKEGAIVEPLIDMGVMTRDGKIVKAMHGKYRQINRFLELVEDELKHIEPSEIFTVVDLCCGKSYLTFVLYHYLTAVKGMRVRMVGLDLKKDVIAQSNHAAQKYGYEHLSFAVQDINAYEYPGKVDMVVALHACDTATDYVLYNAVRWNARLIFSVPCCHHELNQQMEGGSLAILTRYGIVKERAAALMTDALRAHLLACCGYSAQLLEFVDIEHTPKNILIRARRSPSSGAADAWREVRALIDQFGLAPTLLRLITEHPVLSKRLPTGESD